MPKKYLVIADDFTGANDTGVQMKRRGLNTSVIFAGRKLPVDAESIVIDTETRSMTPQDAGQATLETARELNFSDYAYVIKKVDSTLRGNIAAEIKATDLAFGSELVIFAPAFPDLNRTTEGCIHKLNGVRITETEIAKDPKKPVTEDHLQKILQSVYDEDIVYVGLDEVRNGDIDLGAGRVYVFDAVTNDDMINIVRAAMDTGKKVLWVGTAAIADTIMGLESPVYPALGLVGSVSEVTNRQIHQAEQAGAILVKVPIHKILDGSENVEKYFHEAAGYLRQGKDTILCSSSSYDRSEMELSVRAGKEKGMEIWDVGAYVQGIMGKAAKSLLFDAPISGLFVTGGDTAMGVLESIEADGSSILSEIAVGIPLMKIVGGSKDGLRLITKAGAFGKDDVIAFALRKLKED